MGERIKRLLSNSAILAIGNLGTKLISFVMVPFYTYVLSTSQFGVVDLISNSVAMLTPIVSLSIFDAIFRFTMDDQYDKGELFTTGMVITLLGSFVAIVLGLLAQIVFGFNYGFVLSMLLVFSALTSLFLNFIRGIGQIKAYALLGLFFAALNAIFNVIFLWKLHLGVMGYLYASVVSSLIVLALFFVITNIHLYFNVSYLSFNTAKLMLSYSVPLIPNAFAWWFTTDASRFFILAFIGAQANGLYAVANKIPSILTICFAVFSQAWQISAVENFYSEDSSDYYSLVFNKLASFLFIGVTVLTVFSPFIMKYLVSAEFYDAWKLTPFLLLAMLFSNLSGFLGTTYIAAKKTRLVMLTTVVGMLLNGLFNVIFIPLIGVNGAGAGSSLGFLVVVLIRLRTTRDFVNIRAKYRSLFISTILFVVLFFGMQYSDWSAVITFISSIAILIINVRVLISKK